jgi:L-fuculose-phosphate aldolase
MSGPTSPDRTAPEGAPGDGGATGSAVDPAVVAEDLPRRLAVAGRILDDEGCAPGVGGQISARDPLGRGFFAIGFDLLGRVRPEQVALLDDELRLLRGELRLPAAMGTHAAVYRRRPDVHAVVHLHSPNVAALSATGRLLGMHHVSAVLFAGEQVRHVDDGTRPHSAVVDTLGDRRVAIMANHGALLVAASLERAVVEAVTLEFCAGLQLACEAAGGATEIAPAEVEAGRRNFVPHHLAHTWAALEARALDGRPELRPVEVAGA